MGQARERQVRVHLQHVHRSLACARAAAGPTESCARCMRGCLQGWGHTCGGLVSMDSKRLVTKLIAGWIVLPAL